MAALRPRQSAGRTDPSGVLTAASTLCVPPAVINVAEILPANLPAAWPGDETNALAIATALSQKAGKTLPWKTVKDVIGASLQARFTQLADGSAPWPCDLPAAQTVKIKVAPAGPGGGTGGGGTGGGEAGGGTPPQVRVAAADFEPSQIQDLGDLIPALLEIKAKSQSRNEVPRASRIGRREDQAQRRGRHRGQLCTEGPAPRFPGSVKFVGIRRNGCPDHWLRSLIRQTTFLPWSPGL